MTKKKKVYLSMKPRGVKTRQKTAEDHNRGVVMSWALRRGRDQSSGACLKLYVETTVEMFFDSEIISKCITPSHEGAFYTISQRNTDLWPLVRM